MRLNNGFGPALDDPLRNLHGSTLLVFFIFVLFLFSDFLGCYTLSSTPAGIGSIAYNSATQCAQLCLPSQTPYAAIGDDTCYCLDDMTSSVTSLGDCINTCGGNRMQACGGINSNGNITYNLLNICMLYVTFKCTVNILTGVARLKILYAH